MNPLTVVTAFIVLSVLSATVIQKSEIRAKRQWGGQQWGGGKPGGWQQQSWNNQNNRNKINAQENKYNCQTEGIDLMGIPISEYNCQTSGQSARVSTSQQSQQNQGMMSGPIGAIMSEFGR